jgi:hypothetical protein
METWGTFSVTDHLGRRAFVADVILYDRLVIPVPDAEERRLAGWYGAAAMLRVSHMPGMTAAAWSLLRDGASRSTPTP